MPDTKVGAGGGGAAASGAAGAASAPAADTADAVAAELEAARCARKPLPAKPGLTAFDAGSVAYLRLANEPAGEGGGGVSPPDATDDARTTVGQSPSAAAMAAAAGGRGAGAAPAPPLARVAMRGTLIVSYLSSYTGMGMVRVGCASGCACNGTTIDAHREATVSVEERAPMAVELHSSGDGGGGSLVGVECVLRVEVLMRTRSSGHKFKIEGLTLRWRGEEGMDGGSEADGCH